MRQKLLPVVLLLFMSSNIALAQTTTFTYQGKLTDNGTAANGSYDIQFKLFDTASVGTGTQLGPTISNATVSVTAGIFTVQLDFGSAAFSGPPRFLELGVRPGGSPNAFNLLTPRQPVTATPYSVRSLNSSVADVLSSACVGCVSSTQVGSVNGSVVSGTIPIASVPAGSANYLQNTNSQQAASNFNISGNGTAAGSLSANVVNATTQYNLGGARMLSSPGNFNLFVGAGNGNVNTGAENSFVGHNAGLANSTGTFNSFFGAAAGAANTSGGFNTFFGNAAGILNVSGTNNAFFGSGTGYRNTASENSFFGSQVGGANTTSSGNSFFGYQAGIESTASENTFFGHKTGNSTTSGASNSFFGKSAGAFNTTGDHNTLIGNSANVGSNNLSFATAIGASAVVSNSNSVVLGRAADTVRVPGSLNVSAGAVISGTLFGQGGAVFQDNVAVTVLGSAGNTSLCRNASSQIATCSSSLRYKTSVQPFIGGLEVVRRLRPITFNWKADGMHDLGFAAEEVNSVEPLLATRNEIGEIEGVKYGQITAVLVNAIKEQQIQIAGQQQTIKQQQRQIDTLKKLIWRSGPRRRLHVTKNRRSMEGKTSQMLTYGFMAQ